MVSRHAPANASAAGIVASTFGVLAGLWPWLFGICAVNGVFLVVGSVILVYVFGLNRPDLFVGSFFFAVLSLLSTVFAGVSYDVQRIGGGAVAYA